MPSEPSGVVAEFSCSAVSETLRLEGGIERGISFRLAGYLGALEPREAPTSSWTGERSIKRYGSELDLGVSWPGPIELRNDYLWEQSKGPSRGRYASVPTLHFGCEVSRAELSDEAFLANAKALADDTTLLISFANRQWIVWYSYSFWTPGSLSQHRFHSSRDISNQKNLVDDSPVGMEAAEFLRVCLPNFRERRANDEDLRLPIVYSVPKAGFRHVEERFASAFWALEKLLDLFGKLENRERILGSSDFKRISRNVKEVFGRAHISAGNWGEPPVGLQMIQEKIPELNRPSIGAQLEWLCGSLNVDWRDLYPSSCNLKVPRFIKTRNEIFHSNVPIDGGLVVRETYRVALVFERLVLNALGWSGAHSIGRRAAAILSDR